MKEGNKESKIVINEVLWSYLLVRLCLCNLLDCCYNSLGFRMEYTKIKIQLLK